MCLNLVPFPISPRNSAIAVAHLVKSVGVMQMLVSPDPAMQRLCSEAQDILRKDGIELDLLPMLQYEQISDESADATGDEEVVFPKLDIDRTVCIYHSSGKLCVIYDRFMFHSDWPSLTSAQGQPPSPSQSTSGIERFCNGLWLTASLFPLLGVQRTLD